MNVGRKLIELKREAPVYFPDPRGIKYSFSLDYLKQKNNRVSPISRSEIIKFARIKY